MKNPPRITVAVVTFNSSAMLPGLLDSLEVGMAGVGPYEVMIVDNNSRDASVEIARNHRQKPTVIEMGSNAGYAAAINAAMDAMHPESHLLVLNPDLRMYARSAKALLDCFENPTVGIAVPRNFKEDGTTDPTIRQEPSVLTAWSDSVLGGKKASKRGWGEMIDTPDRYEHGGPIEWATGSALLVSARARATVGRWDESFFLYSEEVDYQRRAREAGFDVVYEPRSQVMHKGGDSGTNPKLFALLTANRVRYYRRHHGPVSTLLFRLGLATGEAIRITRGKMHRAGLLSVFAPERTVTNFLANRPS
ncbi:MAG: glycosyltransferase family 2 protein [Mesorhizobium sp.]